jgi:hypothetical protein
VTDQEALDWCKKNLAVISIEDYGTTEPIFIVTVYNPTRAAGGNTLAMAVQNLIEDKHVAKDDEHWKFSPRRDYVQFAVDRERERCAMVAQIWTQEFYLTKEAEFAHHIAALIRSYPGNPNMLEEFKRRGL